MQKEHRDGVVLPKEGRKAKGYAGANKAAESGSSDATGGTAAPESPPQAQMDVGLMKVKALQLPSTAPAQT